MEFSRGRSLTVAVLCRSVIVVAMVTFVFMVYLLLWYSCCRRLALSRSLKE